jgi:Ca2+-binding RTX toxin-like protein
VIEGNSIWENAGGTGTDDAEIRVRGYTQTYPDSDPLNDVFVRSSGVSITGNTIGYAARAHAYAVSYSDAGTPVIASNTLAGIMSVSVADTSKQGSTPVFVAQVTAGDDVITGTGAADSITGDSGNDIIYGGGGNDLLYGADGNDTLDGGAGIDMLQGGLGNDTYVMTAGDQAIELAGGGIDRIITSANSFSLAALSNIENLAFNGSGGFTGTGNAAGNIITGGAGSDRLLGGGGNDVLCGGRGRDILTGGTGTDVFDFNSIKDSGITFAARDVISDFAQGADHIDLRTIDATAKRSGNQAFSFIGQQPLHGKAGELHYKYSGANTLVEADTSGDGKADFQIMIAGHHALTKGDFYL